jgi:acetoin utilization protein AcuB
MSDRDIKRALDPLKRSKRRMMNVGGLFFLLEPILVREVMTRNPITVSPEVAAREAAAVMVAERFGALPVVDEEETVGIITETDLLRYFASLPDQQPAPAPEAPRARPARKRK